MARVFALSVVALACSMALPAMAQQTDSPTPDSLAQSAVETQVQQQEQRLQNERRHYPSLFKLAYQRYPGIPAGTLEALAYSQSRWHHLRPDNATTSTVKPHTVPQGWGVMGLYAGDGFADQVSEAAALLNVAPEKIKTDPLTNILAAAALLDKQIAMAAPAARTQAAQGRSSNPAALAQALQRYAGFGNQSSQVGDYARASFAYDVLLGLDRGVNDNGIQVPEKSVEWETGFAPDTLIKLNAPMLRLNVADDKIEAGGYSVDPVTEQLSATTDKSKPAQPAASPNVSAQAAAAVDFPGARWATAKYSASRNGTAIREVVIHTMEGTYAGTINWFQILPADKIASAHYLIRSSDGQITQMVRESRTAWHARTSHSPHSIGIEHEGKINNPSWYTNAMYNASAAITLQSCKRYAGIDCKKALKSNTSAKLNDANFDVLGHINLTANTHTDPGPYWNWPSYYARINPNTTPSAYQILDTFETSLGNFNTSPAYSGSSKGITAASTLTRNCTQARAGKCSMHLVVADDPNSSANWEVRMLSAGGDPARNAALTRNGRVAVWAYAYSPGASIQVSIDDSDGTERSIAKPIPAKTWTYFEWDLRNDANWDVWAGKSNGRIDAASVKLDAVWLLRPNIGGKANFLFDQVQLHKK